MTSHVSVRIGGTGDVPRGSLWKAFFFFLNFSLFFTFFHAEEALLYPLRARVRRRREFRPFAKSHRGRIRFGHYTLDPFVLRYRYVYFVATYRHDGTRAAERTTTVAGAADGRRRPDFLRRWPGSGGDPENRCSRPFRCL